MKRQRVGRIGTPTARSAANSPPGHAESIRHSTHHRNTSGVLLREYALHSCSGATIDSYRLEQRAHRCEGTPMNRRRPQALQGF